MQFVTGIEIELLIRFHIGSEIQISARSGNSNGILCIKACRNKTSKTLSGHFPAKIFSFHI